ncbi:fibronectin type III domain protein [Ostertagia ostertagi]
MERILAALFLSASVLSEEVYELRIYDGASRGTRLTMGVELQRRFEVMKNCFGQLETDVDWIEYQSSRNAFYTSSDLPGVKPTGDLTGTLHLLCTGNRMHSLDFRIHVTHRNHHPPTFNKPEYHFFVPVTLTVGEQVGKMEVHDNDPVIYNSERSLSFTHEQPFFSVHSDGTLILKEELTTQIAFKPIRMEVLAIDYGSPQLFTLANVTIVPVTISPVRGLRVNVATEDYQIFEWESPSYGHPEKYRLTIARGESMHYEEELDARRTVALTKVAISPSGNFTFKVSALDANGETPSEWQRFTKSPASDRGIVLDLSCNGDCSSGGVPLCYYGAFNRLEQFVDSRGAHCQCFHGFVGVGCDKTDNCQPEKTVDSYGGLDWREASANATVQVPCPYNTESDKQKVERACEWNKQLGRAVWARQKEKDKCKPQASVLTHLGMLGTFALNANGVSTIHTVAQIDFDSLQGNTTLAKSEMWSILSEFSMRLPSPFTLVSPDLGLHLKAMQWVKDSENFRHCSRYQVPCETADHRLRPYCEKHMHGQCLVVRRDQFTKEAGLHEEFAEWTPTITDS